MATTQRTYRNPQTSPFAASVKESAGRAALALLKARVAANPQFGANPTVYVSSGTGARPLGEAIGRGAKPFGQARQLVTLRPEFLPFPGSLRAIAPVLQDASRMPEAIKALQAAFVAKAPRGTRVKNHRWRYADGLVFRLNGRDIGNGAIPAQENSAQGVLVEAVNVVPYASRLEELRGGTIMYQIARDLAQAYGPGIVVGFDFVNSDRYGLVYGPGTGGPAGGAVYALPRITLAAGQTAVGRTSTFVKPGVRARRRARAARKAGAGK
jgi:hypothetical protein